MLGGRLKSFSSELDRRAAVGIGDRPAVDGGVKYGAEGEAQGDQVIAELEAVLVEATEVYDCPCWTDTRFDCGGVGFCWMEPRFDCVVNDLCCKETRFEFGGVGPCCTDSRLDCGGETLRGSGLLKTELRLLFAARVPDEAERASDPSPGGAREDRRV